MRAKKPRFDYVVVEIYRVEVVLFIIRSSILVGWPMRELLEWLFFCRPRAHHPRPLHRITILPHPGLTSTPSFCNRRDTAAFL
jgi:hypothetical protein